MPYFHLHNVGSKCDLISLEHLVKRELNTMYVPAR